jgi:uncharacterized membrane protein YsdA (DUF1294 family)
MARAISRSTKQTTEGLSFWAAFRVVLMPLIVLMVLPFILIYSLSNNSFFLLILNLILALILFVIWFHMSREFLKTQGWRNPEKRLLVAFFAGLIPFMLLTRNFPLPSLFLFVCLMQTVLLVKQSK